MCTWRIVFSAMIPYACLILIDLCRDDFLLGRFFLRPVDRERKDLTPCSSPHPLPVSIERKNLLVQKTLSPEDTLSGDFEHTSRTIRSFLARLFNNVSVFLLLSYHRARISSSLLFTEISVSSLARSTSLGVGSSFAVGGLTASSSFLDPEFLR